MAYSHSVKAMAVMDAIKSLEPLHVDEYFVAFGPAGRQFGGTLDGYSAYQLPANVEADLLDGNIKKVLWASFGDGPDSYFFVYELKIGHRAFRVGRGIPATLGPFIDACTKSLELVDNLRVQLGANDAYIAWSGAEWYCQNVPHSLQAALSQLSSQSLAEYNRGIGRLTSGTISNVAWHGNGTYYLKNNTMNIYEFQSNAVQKGWYKLWDCNPWDKKKVPNYELKDLIHVSIDSYSPTGDTFAFFKKSKKSGMPDFVLQFEPDDVVFRLGDKKSAIAAPEEQPDRHELVFRPGDKRSTIAAPEEQAHRHEQDRHEHDRDVEVSKSTGDVQACQWAYAKRAGRSHMTDLWELDLQKGQKVQIVRYVGNEWYVAQDRRGNAGYVHGSRLDFKKVRKQADAREAYARWAEDIEKQLKFGTLRAFPDISLYMNACTKETCQPLKKKDVKICMHDLHRLLRGSGKYSEKFLKEHRNKFHPDTFARYCHPDHAKELTRKAEELFVTIGMLIDLGEKGVDDSD